MPLGDIRKYDYLLALARARDQRNIIIIIIIMGIF